MYSSIQFTGIDRRSRTASSIAEHATTVDTGVDAITALYLRNQDHYSVTPNSWADIGDDAYDQVETIPGDSSLDDLEDYVQRNMEKVSKSSGQAVDMHKVKEAVNKLANHRWEQRLDMHTKNLQVTAEQNRQEVPNAGKP
jgi:hypothetical protein